MMNTLTLLLVALSLPCCTGQSMESIPSSSEMKKPGETLSLSCRGSGFTFSCCVMSWIRQPAGKALEWIGSGFSDASKNTYASSVQGRIEVTRDDSNSMVYLRLSNLKPEDSAVYYCARVYSSAFDYWGKGTMVTVTSATSTRPTVFPLMQCGSGTGDMVTLGCLATGFTPSSLTYAWSKNGAALTDSIQYPPVQKGDVYTGISQIHVRRQDWDARESFQCAVTHPAGNVQTNFIKPKVTYVLPTELKVLASSGEEQEASFSCFARDFSPKDYEIKWLKNEAEIPNKIYEIKMPLEERQDKNGTTLYSAASFLTVPASEWTVDTKFTCEFEGKGENGATFMNSSVTYKHTTPGNCEVDVDIKITGPTLADMFLNRKGTIVCQVKVNEPYVGRILWEDEKGNEMAGASKTFNDKGTFSLPLEITYDEWSKGIKRYCVVEHENLIEPLKELYERSFGGQTQRPAVFMLPPVEHTRKETVTLTCYVKDFFPQEVLVTWLVDDEEAGSKYKFYTTNPVESNGSYFAYGQLSLSLEQWKKNDVVYSCVVHHQSLVNTTNAIVRSIGHRTFENTNLVNLNMNIPETCKAQ
nr:immunoglobulin mu heavy chain [Siniperca knerii]